MKQILKLVLSQSDYLSFEIGYPFNEMHKWGDAELFFKTNDHTYLLSDSSMFWDLNELIEKLVKAVQNELHPYPSIQKDLGYLWNEELQGNNEKFEYKMLENTRMWVGLDFLVWSTPGSARPELSTWLYNNDQGDIIMEVTPSYSWHYREREPDEKYITYGEFIKNYKPLLVRTISSEIARAWIQQSENMLKTIENEAA